MFPPVLYQQWLLPYDGATITPTSLTCSTMAPNALGPTATVNANEVLFRSSCKASVMNAYECPYLCGGAESLILKECFR